MQTQSHSVSLERQSITGQLLVLRLVAGVLGKPESEDFVGLSGLDG